MKKKIPKKGLSAAVERFYRISWDGVRVDEELWSSKLDDDYLEYSRWMKLLYSGFAGLQGLLVPPWDTWRRR